MKSNEPITIVGAGQAGRAFIEKFRIYDQETPLILVDRNSYSFNKKEFVSTLSIEGWKNLNEWSQQHNVEFVQGCVDRISARRRKIYFKENETRVFSRLVLATGLQSRKAEIKGEHREGFFYFSQFDPFRIRDLLKISENITVVALTVLGVRFAATLRKLGKEVTVVGKSWDFLGEDQARVVKALHAQGVLFYFGVSFEEAIGEGVLKAVKISPLKVFAAQMVFMDSGFVPYSAFFEDEGFALKEGFSTSEEGIYAIGSVTQAESVREVWFLNQQPQAQAQAHGLAQYLCEGIQPPAQEVLDFTEKTDMINSLCGGITEETPSIATDPQTHNSDSLMTGESL